MLRRALVAGVSALAVVAGVFTLDTARGDPGYSFAGSSTAGAVALLGAGWALIACGLAFGIRRPRSRFGLLLATAGFAWFLLEWNNPGIGSSLAFTIGLALYAACPPLAAHAVLAYPGGGLSSAAERVALAFAYLASVFVLGVLPALVFDPQAEDCFECPENLILVVARGDLAADFTRWGIYLGLAWAVALAALVAWRLARASLAARHAGWPVLVPGGAYLALVAAMFAASLDRGLLVNGTLERRLWLAQAVALAAVAVGVGWGWVRARRARASVARVVLDLAQSPPPGGLHEVLAGIIGDPGLVLAYPVGDAGRLVDADGRPVELPPNLERTSLVREQRPVAVLAHTPGLLDDEQLVDEVTAAARLALENERLQAEVRARLEELRASRMRIVEAGDAERKRLERDLHDGAQQRLVGLSLSLRLVRSQLGSDDSNVASLLAEAEEELRRATAELRELAHGIFPAVLEGEGLAAGIEALAEDGPVPIRVLNVPDRRFAAPVESAAYTVVAELARQAPSALTVSARGSNGRLVVEVETHDLASAFDVVELEDRVGAIEGRLEVEHPLGGGVRIRAELPTGEGG